MVQLNCRLTTVLEGLEGSGIRLKKREVRIIFSNFFFLQRRKQQKFNLTTLTFQVKYPVPLGKEEAQELQEHAL